MLVIHTTIHHPGEEKTCIDIYPGARPAGECPQESRISALLLRIILSNPLIYLHLLTEQLRQNHHHVIHK